MNHNLKMKVNVETMKELMSWLKRSNLADKFPLLLKTDNVEKVIPKSKFNSFHLIFLCLDNQRIRYVGRNPAS